MKTQEYVIEKLRELKPGLLIKYPIESIALFGSYARGDYHEESDVDLIVKLNGSIGSRIISLALEIEESLGIRVEIVTDKAIKKVYLPTILKEMIPI